MEKAERLQEVKAQFFDALRLRDRATQAMKLAVDEIERLESEMMVGPSPNNRLAALEAEQQ